MHEHHEKLGLENIFTVNFFTTNGYKLPFLPQISVLRTVTVNLDFQKGSLSDFIWRGTSHDFVPCSAAYKARSAR